MNNSNGRELAARAARAAQSPPGAMVTIRTAGGTLATGRAYASPDGLYMRAATRHIHAVTPDNIVSMTI